VTINESHLVVLNFCVSDARHSRARLQGLEPIIAVSSCAQVLYQAHLQYCTAAICTEWVEVQRKVSEGTGGGFDRCLGLVKALPLPLKIPDTYQPGTAHSLPCRVLRGPDPIALRPCSTASAQLRASKKSVSTDLIPFNTEDLKIKGFV